jgi:hypothetical protein
MTHKLTRRQLLKYTLAGGLGGIVAARLPAALTAQAQTTSLAGGITQAATQFLNALDAPQRAKATYAFTDQERYRWHWTTPSGFPRNGLPLREMTDAQQALALALLRASSSELGQQKALDIISLQNDLGNDPQLYFVTVFGTPSSTEAWGWRIEGHHLSRHFTITGDTVSMMPFFLGAWPTENDAGLRAMAREEDAARELIVSLDEAKRATAIFQSRTLTRHVTWNNAEVTPLDPVGLGYADLGTAQQGLVDEILSTYMAVLPDEIAALHLGRIDAAGRGNIRFGWAGPLEPRRPHYYRLQGPTFLLEFDCSRNGGTHIHSVWRDFEQEWGRTAP